MREVKIQIYNQELEDLGIEQETRYTTLRFNEKWFIGYWISNNGETLSFYLGDQCFIAKNCDKNINMFEELLNKT